MWFKYALIFAIVRDVVEIVYSVGRPCEVRSSGSAAVAVVYNALLVWGILENWGKC